MNDIHEKIKALLAEIHRDTGVRVVHIYADWIDVGCTARPHAALMKSIELDTFRRAEP